MAKIASGIGNAALRFVIVGIAFPFLLEYFSPTLSAYVRLPRPNEVWAAFILFGALYAVTSFLQTAYSKGDYPWLLGKIGTGVVSITFFTYLFLLLPKSVGSAGAGLQPTGLLYLIYLAVALGYSYLVLDFYDARRSRFPKQKAPLAPA